MITCPVCGFNGLGEPVRDSNGAPSFEICPCCGTEFGYDDATRTHEDLRNAWIANGALWWSSPRKPPANWSATEQLKRAGFPTES